MWLTVSEGGALNVVDIGPTKTHKNQSVSSTPFEAATEV